MKHPAVHEAIFQLFYDIGACLYKSGQLDDITLPTMELRAMRAVKTAGQASPAQIASVLKRDRAQVTRLINELTEKGMLVSEPNPKDKRSRILKLTAAGSQIFDRVLKAEHLVQGQLLDGIEDSDLDAFFHVAGQLSKNAAKISLTHSRNLMTEIDLLRLRRQDAG